MISNDGINAEKQYKYMCHNCKFYCNKQSNYNNHLKTDKHIKKHSSISDIENNKLFICDCGKMYKYRQGLHSHKKICNILNQEFELDENEIIVSDDRMQNTVIDSSIDCSKLLVDIVKNNQEFQLQMFEMVKTGMTQLALNNINHTNNVNSNNSFNLNFFLNDKCKDAMNMSEFIESVKVTVNDLENINNVGYVKGMSDVIVRELRELDIYKRPIHCSDSKREVIHIKENNEWIKDDPSNSILRKSINKIGTKHYGVLEQWKNDRPGFEKSDSQHNDMFLNLMAVLCGGTNENVNRSNYEKVVKNIVKEITIDKNALT